MTIDEFENNLIASVLGLIAGWWVCALSWSRDCEGVHYNWLMMGFGILVIILSIIIMAGTLYRYLHGKIPLPF